MSGDLTQFTLGQENGVSVTYRLSLEKWGDSGFHPTLASITALLSKEFTKLGYQLHIDGITSWSSKGDGSNLTS